MKSKILCWLGFHVWEYRVSQYLSDLDFPVFANIKTDALIFRECVNCAQEQAYEKGGWVVL